MIAERDGDEIVLRLPLQVNPKAKEIPGARHDSKERAWRYPLTIAVCYQLRGVFGEELQVGPELAAWYAREYAERVEPALRAREEKA
jgi:hypothetical protein